jgi:hypothetical protein
MESSGVRVFVQVKQGWRRHEQGFALVAKFRRRPLEISPATVPSPRVYKQFIYVPFGRCHDVEVTVAVCVRGHSN